MNTAIDVFGMAALGALHFAIMIPYVRAVQRALCQVSARYRLMDPRLAWLMLVPVLNIGWHFFLVMRVTDSLRDEFEDRDCTDAGDCGKLVGLCATGFAMVGAVFLVTDVGLGGMRIGDIPYSVVSPYFLVACVLFVLFWARVSRYSSVLAEKDQRKFNWIFERNDHADRMNPSDGPPSPDTNIAADKSFD